MAAFEVEIVVRTENVARHHRGELTAMLFVVRFVHHVNQAFGVAVAEVGRMRWTIVDLKLNHQCGKLRQIDVPWSHQWDTGFCLGICRWTSKIPPFGHQFHGSLVAHCHSCAGSSSVMYNFQFVFIYFIVCLPESLSCGSCCGTIRRPLRPNV